MVMSVTYGIKRGNEVTENKKALQMESLMKLKSELS